MKRLLDAKLIHPVIPKRYVFDLPRFEEGFVDIAENLLRDRRRLRESPAVQIHVEKLERLVVRLEAMGLVFGRDEPWVYMPAPVGEAFMAYLAGRLSEHRDLLATPITNVGHVLRSDAKRADARKRMLEHLLPVPTGVFDVDKMARFRAKHGRKASAFRSSIEIESIRLAAIEDDHLFKQATVATIEKLTDERDALADAMKSQWPKITFAALVPLALAGLGVVGPGVLDSIPSVASAILGIAGTGYGSWTVEGERKALAQQPMSFAVAMQKFGQI